MDIIIPPIETGEIIVSWTKSDDLGVTGYYIYWDTVSHAGGIYTDYANSQDVVGRDVETISITGLIVGLTYYINISSHGPGGHDVFESGLYGEISLVASAYTIIPTFEGSNTFFAPDRAADYLNQLKALLPFGPAWYFDDDSTNAKLIDAWSQEFSRIQESADYLIDQADPRITVDFIFDYERIFGLPTDCMAGIQQSLAQRHNALISQMTAAGGQSIDYFIGLALSAGYDITITEFFPFSVGMTVADLIYDQDWDFAWQINAPATTVSSFLVTSGVDESLASWGNNLLECLINRYKPAHTIAIFSYA